MSLKRLLERRLIYFTRHDFYGGKQRMKGYILVELEPRLESRNANRVRFQIHFPEDSFWDAEGWGEYFPSGRSIYDRRREQGPYLHLVGDNLRGNIHFDLKYCLAREAGSTAGVRDLKAAKSSKVGKAGKAVKDAKEKKSSALLAEDEIQIGGTYSFDGDNSQTNGITGSTSEDTSDGNSEKEPPVIHPPW